MTRIRPIIRNPARFYMCGMCVQTRMQPHPRMYAPAQDEF